MKYSSQNKQLSLDFLKSSLDSLDKTNRWVVLGNSLPWAELERAYNARLDNDRRGAGNKPARLLTGACIIKHKLSLSDEEAVAMIQENPYMQYLCGLSEFTDRRAFDPSLLVTVRKRLSEADINAMTLSLLKRSKSKAEEEDTDKDNPSSGGKDSESIRTDSEGRTHKGTLKVDATCADAEMRYPVDVDIIHDGCKLASRYLSRLAQELGIVHLRSSYKDARRFYILLVKRKKKGRKLVRQTISMLLDCLGRDLRKLCDILACNFGSRDLLAPHEQRTLTAIFDMYAQQSRMHRDGTHRCENRIVSVFQPHVRPIVRGKAKAKTEFGAKIGVAVCQGYTFIDHHSWDAYNEQSDLRTHIELYKQRFGHLPDTILADKIYMNAVNRKLLKSLEITTYCKPLGRPPKTPPDQEFLARQAKAVGERNEVECTFGTGKRIYRANNIRAKLPDTARCWTAMCYFVKNVMKFLRELCLCLDEICRFLMFGATGERHLCLQVVWA